MIRNPEEDTPEKKDERRENHLEAETTPEISRIRKKSRGRLNRILLMSGLVLGGIEFTTNKISETAGKLLFTEAEAAAATKEPGHEEMNETKIRSELQHLSHAIDHSSNDAERNAAIIAAIPFLVFLVKILLLNYLQSKGKKPQLTQWIKSKLKDYATLPEYILSIISAFALAFTLEGEARKECLHELAGILKTVGLIGGAITYGEGVKIDIEKAYASFREPNVREEDRKPVSLEDKVGILALAASVTSPLVTTVGSSSISKPLVTKLAEEVANESQSEDAKTKEELKKDIYSISQRHVSNLSGLLFVGDPPFLVLVKNYGILNALLIQLESGLIPACVSLVKTIMDMNRVINKARGIQDPPLQEQLSIAYGTLKRNIPFIAHMMKNSLQNLINFIPGLPQSKEALQFDFEEAVLGKWKKIKLFFKGEKIYSEQEQETELMKSIAQDKKEMELQKELKSEPSRPSVIGEITNLVEKYDKAPKKSTTELLKSVTDIHHFEKAAGDVIKDIFNILPLQLLTVPALKILFKIFFTVVVKPLTKGTLSSIGIASKTAYDICEEIAVFLTTGALSAFADNMVACEVGVSLLPSKPNIPYTASIVAGTAFPFSNSANMALTSLQEFNCMDAWVRKLDNMKMGAFTLIYNLFVSRFAEFNILKA